MNSRRPQRLKSGETPLGGLGESVLLESRKSYEQPHEVAKGPDVAVDDNRNRESKYAEREFLLHRGTTFKVEKHEIHHPSKTHFIHMKVVHQP